MTSPDIPHAGYAAFRLRFRAWLIDSIFVLMLFIFAGVVLGSLFEEKPVLRVISFYLA